MSTDHAVTVLLVLSCLAVGFIFGVEIVVKLALAEINAGPAPTAPAWLDTAKTARMAATAVFGLSAVGATVVYVREQQ